MDDVAKWLGGLGLQQFVSTFALFQLDFDALRSLSDQELQEMQIPPGPRKKILAAIKLLNEADRPPERRQITLLFCDLVNSTEYAVRLEPEDFQILTETYLQRCTNIVRSRSGMIVNYSGDALLALFGYPFTEEDDADRAVQAALDIVQIAPSIDVSGGPPVQVRIGVASGLAVVAKLLGASKGGPPVPYGPLPSLAQRLQALALPQTVLTDQHTYNATTGAFEFTDIGLHSLKGLPELRVWRVERPRILESRFAKKTRLFRLVARSAQLRKLVTHWDKVVAERRGRVVFLSGEPGIGKSRLAFEVQQRIARCTHLSLQCSATFSNSAFYPFLNLLKRYAGIRDGDPPHVTRSRLETILATSSVSKEVSLPIFERLLSIPQVPVPQPGPAPVELSSGRQQAISRRVLVDWLHHVAQLNPVLATFEDEQWIDPSSRDVLDVLINEAFSHPMLILVTSRGKSAETGRKARHVFEMQLKRLSRRESQTLVHDVAAGANLPEEVRARVLNKAEGVPLYVEELTRAAMETGLPHDPQEQEAPKSDIRVPRVLQLSLLSRLDKLGSGKVISQVAAVIGREFDLKLLAHLCGLSRRALGSAIVRLTEAGLVAPQLFANRSSYAFTHALLQEAARSTLVRERRQELHRLVAQAIESLDPKNAAEHPELLAQHFAEAGMFERAADCWLSAGRNVAKTWAKVEAANMFAMGLACLERLPVSRMRSEKALRFELEQGDVLYATFGYVTREGSTAYRNAMRLSEELGDSEALISALDGLFGTAFNSARFTDAEWASDQLIEIGRKSDSLRARVLGLQFKGMSIFCGGNFRGARRYLERSLGYEAQAKLIGSDFPSMAYLYLSWTMHLLGHPRQALEQYSKAEAVTRRQAAARVERWEYRLSACLGNGCILLALQNNTAKLKEATEELVPLAHDHGLNLWENMGNFFTAWAMESASHDPAGLQSMQTVCDRLGEQKIDKSCYLGLLASAYIQSGNLGKAVAAIEQGLEHAASTGEYYFAAELTRLRGEVQLQLKDDAVGAEASFREAINIAREQGAKTWEIKATQSLASLWDTLGRQFKIDSDLELVPAELKRRPRGRRPFTSRLA
ncbi:AAA family ATPase [Sinorhizobium meliloti]|nr:AAA family ATPase [Sinorhizobium meliloti]